MPRRKMFGTCLLLVATRMVSQCNTRCAIWTQTTTSKPKQTKMWYRFGKSRCCFWVVTKIAQLLWRWCFAGRVYVCAKGSFDVSSCDTHSCLLFSARAASFAHCQVCRRQCPLWVRKTLCSREQGISHAQHKFFYLPRRHPAIAAVARHVVQWPMQVVTHQERRKVLIGSGLFSRNDTCAGHVLVMLVSACDCCL